MAAFPAQPLLHLSKCVLRPYHAVDKTPMHLLANNPKVVHYMRDAFPFPYTEESAAAWLRIVKAEGLEKEEAGKTADEPAKTDDAPPATSPAEPASKTPPQTELHLAVCLPDGTFIGSAGLMNTSGDRTERLVREIGYWIGEPYWGRGIAGDAAAGLSRWALSDETAEEAARTLGIPDGERLERVVAHVSVGNTSSARVLEKAGFVHEGTMRRAFRKRDEVHDILVYARIRTDLEGQSV